jgi:hypothetical protein
VLKLETGRCLDNHDVVGSRVSQRGCEAKEGVPSNLVRIVNVE